MKLENIDKATFKKRLNWLQGGLVAGLLVLALLFSALYTRLWSDGGSNTLLNMAAVVTAALILVAVMRLFRDHPLLHEILYVRALKQELNRIYRASRKLEAALQEDRPEALIIRYFQLHGSEHLYELEDNILTVEDLKQQMAELDQRLAAAGLSISVEDYRRELLDTL